jgi:hypothetical protein
VGCALFRTALGATHRLVFASRSFIRPLIFWHRQLRNRIPFIAAYLAQPLHWARMSPFTPLIRATASAPSGKGQGC